MKGLTAERAASWLRKGAYRVFCLLHNLPDTLRAQGALSGGCSGRRGRPLAAPVVSRPVLKRGNVADVTLGQRLTGGNVLRVLSTLGLA